MSQAVIVSRGEYFCAKLMAEYLGYAFVDAKDIIRFKLDKSIDWDATSAKLQAKYAQYDHFVSQVSMAQVQMDTSKSSHVVEAILRGLF